MRAFGATSRAAASRWTAPRVFTANVWEGSAWLFATELRPARWMTASGRAVSTAARSPARSVTSTARGSSGSGPHASATESPWSRKWLHKCLPTKPSAPVTRTRTLPHGRLQALEVGVHHQLDELLESDRRLPSELALRLGWIADQDVYFGRTNECRVDVDVLLPIEACAGESDLAELPHRMRLVRGDDVVLGMICLEHPPHRL